MRQFKVWEVHKIYEKNHLRLLVAFFRVNAEGGMKKRGSHVARGCVMAAEISSVEKRSQGDFHSGACDPPKAARRCASRRTPKSRRVDGRFLNWWLRSKTISNWRFQISEKGI
ncbi:MAG TPA: hypothetical protein VG347_14550 [Verrucomicrobiae bacterium]|nr:hypothetical protein [Verrucomicrobiae bacterium]